MDKKIQIASNISSGIRNKTLVFIALIGTAAVTNLSILTRYYQVAILVCGPITVVIVGVCVASKIARFIQQAFLSFRRTV